MKLLVIKKLHRNETVVCSRKHAQRVTPSVRTSVIVLKTQRDCFPPDFMGLGAAQPMPEGMGAGSVAIFLLVLFPVLAAGLQLL